jgi:hypothetical protein
VVVVYLLHHRGSHLSVSSSGAPPRHGHSPPLSSTLRAASASASLPLLAPAAVEAPPTGPPRGSQQHHSGRVGAAGLPALALVPRRGRGEGVSGRGAGGPRPRGGAGPAAGGGRSGGAQEALDGRRRRRGFGHRPRLRRRGPAAVGRRHAAPAPGARPRGGLAVGALPRHPPAPDGLHHLLVSKLRPTAFLYVFSEMISGF